MYALQEQDEDEAWRAEARCRDGAAALTELFFSEQLDDIGRAKAFCRGCAVREECLDAAIGRQEPWGVWGGELLANGKVLAQKRTRGRPPKVRPPEIVEWEIEVRSA
ncbi:MAG TPA: WhiB family transcriptional regulator [Acidimicrobiia bacterium]|nr:WhiB family transcriptional regulator [Acidimicrobiia bacterium]